MALARCLEKHSPPRGRTTSYGNFVSPLGYPKTALICGNPECDFPGVIWLTPVESQSYSKGERVFAGPNNFAKMEADDTGVKTW
jgi:hypothetical protein